MMLKRNHGRALLGHLAFMLVAALSAVLAVRGVENPAVCAPLETKKDELLRSLRLRLPDREAILSWHTIRVYADYFKRFKKTYHVLMQLESVACKGKELPAVAALRARG